MNRKNYKSESTWEDVVGYSRVVKTKHIIEVAGTTATDGDNIIGENDYFKQTEFILNKIKTFLERADSSLSDVIRTRIYVCDITQWQEVARAHALFFQNIKPASTMVEVSRLIDPKLLVEIEVTAINTSEQV